MAQFSASGKVNYNKLKTKIEENNFEIKNKIALLLEDFGRNVIENRLSKRIQNGGIWVVDKRGYDKSLKSILKWRSYVERRGSDSILLMFRNDALNDRYKKRSPVRYAKYLIGTDDLYKAEGQGLDDDTWLVFREHLKQDIKDIIKTGEWKQL